MPFLDDVGNALALIAARYPPDLGAAHAFSLDGGGELILSLALDGEYHNIVLGREAMKFTPTDLAVEVGKIMNERRTYDD